MNGRMTEADRAYARGIGATPAATSSPYQWERVTTGAQMISLALIYAARCISDAIAANAERRNP